MTTEFVLAQNRTRIELMYGVYYDMTLGDTFSTDPRTPCYEPWKVIKKFNPREVELLDKLRNTLEPEEFWTLRGMFGTNFWPLPVEKV